MRKEKEFMMKKYSKNNETLNGEGSHANGDDNPGDNDDDDDITQSNEDGDDGEDDDEQDDSEGQDGVGEYQLSEDGEEAKSFKLDVRNKKEQASLGNVKEYDQNNIVPSDKKKDARTVLFNQAKTKYSNVARRQEKPSPKLKREISYKALPPAPTLPPLNLGMLPDYIRRLISPPEPVTSKPKTTLKDQLTHFDEEDSSEELEKKIDAMISLLKDTDTDSEDEHNNTDEDDDDDDDTDDYSEESEDDDEDDNDDDQENSRNDVEDKNTIIKRIPRTFGMNLTMGRGYVWNDLLSEPGMPGMSFDIGESGHDSENTRDEAIPQPETTKKPNTSEKPEESKKPNASELAIPFEPFTNVPHPNESRPIHSEDSNSSSDHAPHHDSNNDKNADDEDHKGKPDKDLEDIEINGFKPKLLPDSENSEEKEDEHKEDKNDKESKPITADVTKNKDYDAEEHTLKPNKENHSNHTSKHKKDKHKHKQIFKPENDDSLKELMKNEEFWKWLSDWTSTYMELLMKHIKELVHDEVSRQIKALEPKKDSPLEEKNERDTKEKEEKDYSHNIGNNHSKDDSNSFIHDDKEFIANKNENSNPDNKTSIHDDSRLIIDGKSDAKTILFPDDTQLLMPFTHSTNFDLNNEINEPNYNKNFEEESNDLADFLRNKKHKSGNENRKKPDVNKSNKGKHDKSPTRISATNIFGNAVGSDKVTNIFVFYPSNDEKDSILSSLRPPITGENITFVSGKPDNIDTRVPEISKQKDESTMTENDSNKSTEKINDKMATSSNLLEKNKDVKGGNTEQDSQTEPPTTTPKENEKTRNTTDKMEQEAAPVKEQNITDQPKDDDLSKDIKIRTTTENAISIETITVSSLVKKEQEDIKPFHLENKNTDELKVGNKTESNTDTVNSVTERNLDNKTEITTDKTDQQDIITGHKENHNTEHPEKLIEEQVKEIEEKVAKELEGRISKELEAKLEKELQTKIEQEFSKAIEELNKAKDKEIDKDLKTDENPKEESDKEADKVSSEKDSEKKEDKMVVE